MTVEQHATEAPRFTLALDDLILDGFFKNQNVMFRKLTSMGFSRTEVIDRAKQLLGLSNQFLKRCTIGHPAVALRKCLNCAETFLSLGFHNRLCNRCKGRK
jgi:hypothetical protein